MWVQDTLQEKAECGGVPQTTQAKCFFGQVADKDDTDPG